MSKYSRLLQILNLLRSRQGISAKDLAEECQVSRRTIFRDILSLSSADIPIYYDKGYRLLPGTFLPTLNFDLDEYLTLKSILLSDLFTERAFFENTTKNILTKIEANLNSELKERLKEISPPVSFFLHIKNGNREQALIFKILKQAILEKKSVVLDYGIKGLFRSEPKVDPFKLILRGGRWFLVGNCRDCSAYFPFGLDNIKKVTLTGQVFIQPEDFSLNNFLSHSLWVCQAEIISVELKILKENRFFQENISALVKNISKLKDNSTLYRLRVRGINELARWLLNFPGEVEVKKPLALKIRLNNLLESHQRIYQKGSKVKKWVPSCPLYHKYKVLCKDLCLEPSF
jgi:predicted DNA-binding transcriptional regulator YafY